MRWDDEAIVLSARKHGESAAIVSLLTRAHGRHAGLVHGGAGRHKRGVLQPGNEVTAAWRARLADHLGVYTIELARARAASLLDDAACLAGLSAACAVCQLALPEREPQAAVYEALRALLEALESSPAWPAAYVRWELGLLQELGFGLDLTRCTVTGSRQDLTYVSPRSGRSVSTEAAAPWKDRLLRLPSFLLKNGSGSFGAAEIRDGLVLTGHFLASHVLGPHGVTGPRARERLLDYFSHRATISGDIVDP